MNGGEPETVGSVRPSPKRALTWGVAAAIIALLLGAAVIPHLLRAVTHSFLFHPERGQPATPARYGVDFEELRLVAEDGVRTQAWWIPGPRDLAVVSFHGNAGTMGDRLPHLLKLHQLGVSVLAAEYRGYGDSEGQPSEEGLAADARAALEEARRRASKVVVHGRSLGGAVGIRLASDRPVDGLIAESTFTSLAEMAQRTGIPLAARLIPCRFDSEQRMARVEAPVLLVHGEQDELIPVSMGHRLRDAGGEVRWLEVPGAGHNDAWVLGGHAYWAAVAAFLEEVER